jgi:uncharacterized protein YlxW (UPF0749 family)
LNDTPNYAIGDDKRSIIHDTDIQRALELLKNAGAAAFSVNGQRYTIFSNIKCLGVTIRCNQNRLVPPYVITALGDPAALAEAIQIDQEFNDRQAIYNLVVKIQTADEVVIPAYDQADNIDQYIDLLEVTKP